MSWKGINICLQFLIYFFIEIFSIELTQYVFMYVLYICMYVGEVPKSLELNRFIGRMRKSYISGGEEGINVVYNIMLYILFQSLAVIMCCL